LTPEQEHFWNVLRFDAKTMAVELGTLMEDARTQYGDDSKEFHTTVDRCVFLAMDQAQTELDVIRMMKHWLTIMQLPIDPSATESTDVFHSRYGNLIFKLINTKQCNLMEWNCY
jgi:hypothetical protein|tara:strand:+ start:66 stop:407 length:342 start_codon:yes stop_codon:yes gene_type:complete